VVLTKAVTDSPQVKLPYDQAIKADLAQLYDMVLFQKGAHSVRQSTYVHCG